MTTTAKWVLAATLAAGIASAGIAAPDDKPGAEKSFLALQEVCKSADAAALKKALPDAVGKGMVGNKEKDLSAWRAGFAAVLAKASFMAAREAGDEAVVRIGGLAGAVMELPLHRESDGWTVAAPQVWLVKGKPLDEVNGKAPVALRLAARTTNDEYGDTAFCFAHVTRDPKACANRMDLWYCRNGDLHACGGGTLARVAGKDLAAVTEVPLGVAWKDALAPAAGGVYVLRCRQEGRRDFLVKFKAVAVDEKKVELEWAILGAGFGSPPSIRKAFPLVTHDGADGCDGLCGQNGGGTRSTPDPEPTTATPTPTPTPAPTPEPKTPEPTPPK